MGSVKTSENNLTSCAGRVARMCTQVSLALLRVVAETGELLQGNGTNTATDEFAGLPPRKHRKQRVLSRKYRAQSLQRHFTGVLTATGVATEMFDVNTPANGNGTTAGSPSSRTRSASLLRSPLRCWPPMRHKHQLAIAR
jgi:hypothetical protein